MAIVQRTLLLDVNAWDLVIESNGNIALANAPYSIAQDVASALRTFKGECWYDTENGIPYWQQVLGQLPPLSYVQTMMQNQAKTIANVASATVTFPNFSNRVLQGECLIVDTDGVQTVVEF